MSRNWARSWPIQRRFGLFTPLINPDEFGLWHDCLSHLRATMMCRIISNSKGHLLKNTKVLLSNDYSCEICSQEKLITRPSMTKVDIESTSFLQRIQGDIYGPIHPVSGPFKYFIVLVDVSCRWFHVFLLSTRNVTFACLLALIIKLNEHFPEYPKRA